MSSQDVHEQAVVSTHCVAVIAGMGPGSTPSVRIVNPNDLGHDISNFNTVASDSGGLYVASGDINGDGNADVVAGQHGVVKFRDSGGSAIAQDLTPYGAFGGEIRVAVADLNGDNRAEVITAPGPGGGPHIRAFTLPLGASDLVPYGQGNLGSGIMAYDPNFHGGVYVAAGDINGDNLAEVVTSAGPGGGPHVRGFNADGNPVNGSLGSGFMAYAPNFTGGVRVALGNFSGSHVIVTGAGPGGGPHVREFTVSSFNVAQAAGQAGEGWYAYAPAFTGGVFVAVGDIDTDDATEIITGAGAGGGPHVRAFDATSAPVPGQMGSGIMAFSPSFSGGVTVATGKV
jgi:hypothetical protein